VNRQEHLLSIAHTELEWGVFHRCEDSVEKTTSISEPITSLVEANHWPNVTVYGKAFANQPLALGFAPLHDLGTIHVGRASAVNPTGNFAPLKRSNRCERQSVCWPLKS